MVPKRTLAIEAKLEATAYECWMTCRVGRKKYKSHWRQGSDGVLTLQSGVDVQELCEEDWIKKALESLEEGAQQLMRW